MKTLKVPDMHCANCVARIGKALAEAGIVYETDLAQKLVCVEDGKVKEAIETLDDIGFDARES